MKRLPLYLILLLPQFVYAQLTDLQKPIEALLYGKQLKVGIALCDLSTQETYCILGDERFPMQSVYKFPIALAVLQGVEEGQWQLTDSLFISKSDLPTGTWSPLRERYPEGENRLPIAELIRYTVSQSDNNGCDILLRMIGGPSQADNYLRNLGANDITIANNEAELQRDWQTQFSNWATPRAMLELLCRFSQEQLPGPQTHAFLWQTMTETVTGSVRKFLPDGTIVAHKTGSSGRNSQGIVAAKNDAGILVLPDGRRVAYVIFITESAESDKTNDSIIAEIARMIFHNKIKE